MTSESADKNLARGWHVHKFGGTSLGNADCFRRVANLLLDEQVPRQAAVVSAMAKTTDSLLGLVSASELSGPDVASRLKTIVTRYETTVSALGLESAGAAAVLQPFALDIAVLTDQLGAIALAGKALDRERDVIAGYGELWSSRLLAAYLGQRCEELANGRGCTGWTHENSLLSSGVKWARLCSGKNPEPEPADCSRRAPRALP